jgi:class 3 adenylate cyclase
MSPNISSAAIFLFTDIEGSTGLCEKHPDAMCGALARYDSIMSATVEGHGERALKTVGDAYYAAFEDAPSSLHATCRAQRHLADPVHPGIGALRVRMAFGIKRHCLAPVHLKYFLNSLLKNNYAHVITLI